MPFLIMFLSDGSIDRASSERIALARALCILGMVYVHVPGTLPASSVLPVFLIEGYGRASAALLSVVSGWLCAHTLLHGKRKPFALIASRFRSLILPMLFWAGMTVVIYSAVSFVQPTFLSNSEVESVGATLFRFVNTVLFLTNGVSGPTLHLSFLRDLFVCIALAPLLLFALRRAAAAVLIALGALYIVHAELIVVLRPLILFAFAIGLALRLRSVPTDALDRWWPVWLCGSVFSTLALMLVPGAIGSDAAFQSWRFDLGESALYPLTRLFGALTIWSLTARLAGTRLAHRARLHGPWVFTTYCSHFLVLSVIWAALLIPTLRHLGGVAGEAARLGWFLLAPSVALVCARLLMLLLARGLPGIATAVGIPARYAAVTMRSAALAESLRDKDPRQAVRVDQEEDPVRSPG